MAIPATTKNKNVARQPKTSSKTPPKIGASKGAKAIAMPIAPKSRAASFCGCISRTTARLKTIPLITADCAMRNARKISTLGAKRHPTEASTKITKAPNSTGLRPWRSESGPMINCNTDETARYPPIDKATSA
mgnify:CR=1 FL=1|jgi:hypothetical protein